jgi:protein tyrosine/serine phosphatase
MSTLWRSGQPLAADWANLRTLGITRTLKLNSASLPDDNDAGVYVERIEITDDEAQSILRDVGVLDRIDRAIDAYASDGLLVHCTEGVDRTGIAIARFRVRRCGWSKQAAYDEWVAMGSHNYRGLVAAWNAWEPSQ